MHDAVIVAGRRFQPYQLISWRWLPMERGV